jgi:hypothetical protein
MKKSYRNLSINEKINLKSNFGLGETKMERYKLKTGRKLNRLWKGVGAMLRLNHINHNAPIKSFDYEVSYDKAQALFLPTYFGQ